MKFECLRAQSATPAGAEDDDEVEPRLAKRAKVVRDGENCAVVPFTSAYVELLAERYELKSRCEALVLEHQFIPGFAAEAKRMRENVVKLKKSFAEPGGASVAATPLKGRRKKRPTATSMKTTALEAELQQVKKDLDAEKEKAKELRVELGQVETSLGESVDTAAKAVDRAGDAKAQLANAQYRAPKAEEFVEGRLSHLAVAKRRMAKLERATAESNEKVAQSVCDSATAKELAV